MPASNPAPPPTGGERQLSFAVHTSETAPLDARVVLADLARKNRFVANMFGVMAEAPTLLRAYLMLGRLFEETSLTPSERQVVDIDGEPDEWLRVLRCGARRTAVALDAA